MLGRHLMHHLEEQGISVEYIVDRDSAIHCQKPVLSKDAEWPDIDIMVVTATYDYGEIYRFIKGKRPELEVMSLEHFIMEA